MIKLTRYIPLKNKRNTILFVLLLFILAQPCAYAQKANAYIDTAKIRIGEQVNIHLNVTLPITAKVFWTQIGDTLTPQIEVIKATHVDTTTTSRSDFLNYSQIIKITSFDTGTQVIPPFVINYTYGSQCNMQQLTTEALTLIVQSVAVDTTKTIKDIKPNLEAPVTISEIIPYVIGIIAFAIILLFLIYYLKRRRQNKPVIPLTTQPELPAWQIALNNLDVLNTQKVWQNGKIKDYYTLLTDILRNYLHKQHNIDAKEMTSCEILEACQMQRLSEKELKKMEFILLRSDFAKFAKAQPNQTENIQSMDYAKEFVINTKETAINPTPDNADSINNTEQ